MEWTRCPSCDFLSGVERLTAVHRHDGPVTYATTRCVLGHWLSTPLQHLAALPAAYEPRTEVAAP
jgi:hypothetical protein